MKGHGNLWEQIISFEGLLRAATRAKKGKRFRPAVISFHFDQEGGLWKLHEELTTKSYRPGATAAWIAYHERFLNNDVLADEEEKKLLAALIAISSEVQDVKKLGVTVEVGRRLLECYDNLGK